MQKISKNFSWGLVNTIFPTLNTVHPVRMKVAVTNTSFADDHLHRLQSTATSESSLEKEICLWKPLCTADTKDNNTCAAQWFPPVVSFYWWSSFDTAENNHYCIIFSGIRFMLNVMLMIHAQCIGLTFICCAESSSVQHHLQKLVSPLSAV